MNPALAPARPTHTRYWVIVFAVTLAILSYIDRVCISQAAPVISRDLGLSKGDMGLVFGAFGLAYALFEIPGGWLSDWMGPRKVLLRIVLWWSTFTAATGAAFSLGPLLIIRFLFGAGEAGCFPNLTKAFSVWLPSKEGVVAQGIMWTFARWGGAFTPPLVIAVFKYVSWRWAFVLFGTLGTVWAVLFYIWYRDNPRDHKSVNAGELALLKGSEQLAVGHANVPWAKLVSSRSVLLLWVQYFCLSFPWYFYITWLPTYLQESRKLSPDESANYAIVPLLFGGFGSLVCGFLLSLLVRRGFSARTSRRALATSGFIGACLLLTLSIQLTDARWAMLAMGLASFFNDLAMPPSWASCMDIGGKFAGTVSGSMNMMGNLAGFAAPVLGGYILQWTHNSWNSFLYLMAGVYLLGTFCWPFIDPVTPLESE
ncbi:MAG: MFS transporter [Acidobacteriota bacterium]|nr:MFS transporter [Acidobacteriota bacterium]